MAAKSQIQRRSGVNPLSYLGVDPASPGNLVQQTFAPTTNDLSFNIGDMWVVTPAPYSVWMLVNKADFTATWIQLNGGGGGGGGIQTITGDVGGAVGPDMAGNISLQGGTHYVFTGNPGSNLLTLSDDGTLAYTYTTDSGVATPSSNNLNIVGAGIISTSAVGDTVTITAAGSVPVSIVVDVGGPVTPAGGVLDVLGGNNVTTSGAGNTITVDVTGTTDHAVQIGNATGSLDSIAIGTDGQVLLGATGADPAFATLTSGDGSITFTVGPNSLDIKAAGAGPGVTTIDADSGSCAPAGGILNVFGGENITTSAAGNTLTAKVSGTTQYAPQMGSATGGLDDVGIMTTGELMIGVTGSAPNLARLLAGANISIDDTSSPGNITISSSGGSGDLVLLETQTVSGVTEVVFTSGITNTYNNYLLIVDSVPLYSPTPSPSSYLAIQLSTNSGVSYITSGYENNDSSNDIGLDITNSQSTNSSSKGSGQYAIFNVTSGSGYVTGAGICGIKFPASPIATAFSTGVGAYKTPNITVNALRIVWDSPDLTTIDGTFSLYGYVK